MITLNLDRRPQSCVVSDDSEENNNYHTLFDQLECIVKWFRQEDGYGFLQSGEVDTDIFIHSSKLDPVQAPTLMPGDIIICKIVRGLRGPQVDEVYSYTAAAREEEVQYLDGIVKWFNTKSDFGFVKSLNDPSMGDIFLSGKKARSLGINISDLKSNQKVLFTYKVDPRRNLVVDQLLILQGE